jgi:nucleosome binding factor SPN SPT16 subunit
MSMPFSEDELNELVKLIAEPTFKYMMKRVSNNILDDKHNNKMDIAEFLSVLCAAIASIDANALRWMENFYRIQSGQMIDFEKLRIAHTKNLHDQLKIVLQ